MITDHPLDALTAEERAAIDALPPRERSRALLEHARYCVLRQARRQAEAQLEAVTASAVSMTPEEFRRRVQVRRRREVLRRLEREAAQSRRQ